jgi:GNAT superfamily N-acetyltransferase
MPVTAPGYLALGCFWVSGRYKGHGHGKALLQSVVDDRQAGGSGRPRHGRRHT